MCKNGILLTQHRLQNGIYYMLNSYINLLKIEFDLFSICMLCATIQMTENLKIYIKKKRNNARCFSINYEILLVVKIYESSNMTKVSQPIRIKWLTHCVLNKHITITQLWFGTIAQIIRVDIKNLQIVLNEENYARGWIFWRNWWPIILWLVRG